ncbi:hypothetical protein Psta_0629 [Pirellula staleyi DSM 6068]|uniref:Uncharacterized protein n=1 Tax=Pirellula staleyi (strain ATCC 27377 / DSM 6068 / ICPB 4128) TaxID=530564 RepID=D2R4G8_PIRSD|nr:hypothetical protein [Pirellula staleyi]ADB15316.1 hypothetical protein Psta_0629 [Pirellula staleyi DSM 6068]
MSYNIHLFHPDVKRAVLGGEPLEKVARTSIPPAVREQLVQQLLAGNYELQAESPSSVEYIHKNKQWSIKVTVTASEIALAVPYWDDAENAIAEAHKTASELSLSGSLVIYIPQAQAWSE